MSEWLSESELSTRLGYKLLIAGLSEAGKTAVKRIFFLKQQTTEVDSIAATINYERLIVKIGEIPVTIVDLGGQKVFLKRFLGSFSPFVFSNVKAFLFLIDVENKTTRGNSLQYFQGCVEKLQAYSPNAELYVFFHKNDLVQHFPNYESIHTQLKEQFQLESKDKVAFFRTTIYRPETVIDAFGRIFELGMPKLAESEYVDGRKIGDIEEYAEEFVTYREPVAVEVEESEKTISPPALPMPSPEVVEAESPAKVAGDPAVLERLQGIMKAGTTPGTPATGVEIPAKVTSESEVLDKLQGIMKAGTTPGTPATGVEIPAKVTSESAVLDKLQSLMQATTKPEIPAIEAESPTEIMGEPEITEPLEVQSEKAEEIELPGKEPLPQTYPYLGRAAEEEKVTEAVLTPMKKTVKTEEPVTIEVPTAEASIEEVQIEEEELDRDSRIDHLIHHYGIQAEEAVRIIKSGYVDVFEIAATARIPIPLVLNVLLKYIPFIEARGLNIDVLDKNRILDVFFAHLTGSIKEDGLLNCLIFAASKPELSVDEIAQRLFAKPEKKDEVLIEQQVTPSSTPVPEIPVREPIQETVTEPKITEDEPIGEPVTTVSVPPPTPEIIEDELLEPPTPVAPPPTPEITEDEPIREPISAPSVPLPGIPFEKPVQEPVIEPEVTEEELFEPPATAAPPTPEIIEDEPIGEPISTPSVPLPGIPFDKSVQEPVIEPEVTEEELLEPPAPGVPPPTPETIEEEPIGEPISTPSIPLPGIPFDKPVQESVTEPEITEEELLKPPIPEIPLETPVERPITPLTDAEITDLLFKEEIVTPSTEDKQDWLFTLPDSQETSFEATVDENSNIQMNFYQQGVPIAQQVVQGIMSIDEVMDLLTTELHLPFEGGVTSIHFAAMTIHSTIEKLRKQNIRALRQVETKKLVEPVEPDMVETIIPLELETEEDFIKIPDSEDIAFKVGGAEKGFQILFTQKGFSIGQATIQEPIGVPQLMSLMRDVILLPVESEGALNFAARIIFSAIQNIKREMISPIAPIEGEIPETPVQEILGELDKLESTVDVEKITAAEPGHPERLQFFIPIDAESEDGLVTLPDSQGVRFRATITPSSNIHLYFYQSGHPVGNALVSSAILLDELKYLLSYELQLPFEGGLASINFAALIIHSTIDRLLKENLKTSSDIETIQPDKLLESDKIQFIVPLDVETEEDFLIIPDSEGLSFKVEGTEEAYQIFFKQKGHPIGQATIQKPMGIPQVISLMRDVILLPIESDGALDFAARVVYSAFRKIKRKPVFTFAPTKDYVTEEVDESSKEIKRYIDALRKLHRPN